MRKVRVNKNKKKTWRKHGDVADVENYLEDIRLQERTGGIVADKKNSDLYIIDKKIGKVADGPKTLKCLSHLKPLNTYPDTTSMYGKYTLKRKTVKTPGYSNVYGKNILRTKHKKYNNNEDFLEDSSDFKNDIWSDKSLTCPQNSIDLAEIYDKDYATKLNIIKSKPPPHFELKPSTLKALPTPENGMSYNPTFEDHQALLLKAHAIEKSKLKEEENIMKKAKFTLLPPLEIECNKIQEMSEGLYLQNNVEEEVEKEKMETNVPPLSLRKVSRENKKSKHKRRLEALRNLKLQKVKSLKEKKRQLNDINRLKSLKKEILVEEMVYKEKLEKKKQMLERTLGKRTRRLGKNKFHDVDLDLQLSTELAGSLRKLKPEGNILMDSFKSFQRRNIIEAHSIKSDRKKRKKYKPKYFERKVVKNAVHQRDI